MAIKHADAIVIGRFGRYPAAPLRDPRGRAAAMNPVILLASFVAFALGIAPAAPPALLLGALLLAFARWGTGPVLPAGTLRRALRRVRWLLLAVVITHGWFTPGLTLLPALGGASPSVQGLWLALWRALVLLELVAAAALVLALAGTHGVAGALYRLTPAGGGFRERLAVRVALCFEALPLLQARMTAPADAGSGRLGRWTGAARAVFAAAGQPAADFAPADRLTVAVPPLPALREWRLPLAIALAFAGMHALA